MRGQRRRRTAAACAPRPTVAPSILNPTRACRNGRARTLRRRHGRCEPARVVGRAAPRCRSGPGGASLGGGGALRNLNAACFTPKTPAYVCMQVEREGGLARSTSGPIAAGVLTARGGRRGEARGAGGARRRRTASRLEAPMWGRPRWPAQRRRASGGQGLAAGQFCKWGAGGMGEGGMGG
eukprot:271559-Chlamydomonas_euryale.AAC.2